MWNVLNVPLHFTKVVNNIFEGKEPWQIASVTTVSVLTCVWLWDFLNQPESFYDRGKNTYFRLLKKIPFVSRKIDGELKKVHDLFKNEIVSRCNGLEYTLELPEKTSSSLEILEFLNTHLACGKYKWDKGFVSGTVYYYDEELANLMAEVFKLSLFSNPLHPDVFPGVCKMEAEVIRIVANLFHGSEEACGSMTSGGTESILMACKAYRDYGLRVRGIEKPVMVIPRTAHAAFDKAASYLGIHVKHIDVDDDMCVNIKSMERAINKNTVMRVRSNAIVHQNMRIDDPRLVLPKCADYLPSFKALVGSTPNFPYGTMDDVEKIAKLGLKYNIPVHVDCCLGSFVIAFMPQVGYEVPPFDFAVPGVTSISVDTHKYGFAPKGSSLILYSDPEYRHHQYYASHSWPGGLYGSPSMSGSRSGAIIATCWSTLMYFGRDGYAKAMKNIVQVSKYIESELRKIPGIFVFGKPVSTVIAIGSTNFHIYRLSQALNEKSWNLNMLQFPFGIHICVTQLHTLPGVADRFINDVKSEVAKIMLQPNDDLEGKVAMYGMSSTLPDRTLVGDFTKCYLDAHYYTPKKIEGA